MSKEEVDEYEQEDFSYTDENEDDSLSDHVSYGGGMNEEVRESQSMERFFDTEQILTSIQKTLQGYTKQDGEWVPVAKAVARTEFINAMINSLRSVINPHNMLSNMDDEEIETLLLEKNKELIFMMLDEPTLEDELVEHVGNLLDHHMETFMGLVKGGWSSDAIKQLFTGNYAQYQPQQKGNDGIGSISWGDKEILRIGGK